MRRATLILCLALLLAGCGVRESKLDPGEAKARAEYARYVEPYRKMAHTNGWFGPGPMGLSLLAAIVEGETEESAPAPTNNLEILRGQFRLTRNTACVCTNGAIMLEAWNSSSVGGYFGRRLSNWELNTRLSRLLAQLRDDGGRLPPVGKRVILQVPDGDAWRVRVYNGSNAPTEVQQVLQLIGLKLRL